MGDAGSIDAKHLWQSLTHSPITDYAGEVEEHPSRDVHHVPAGRTESERLQPIVGPAPQHGHAHWGHRPTHPLHVTRLQINPKVVSAGIGGHREDRGYRPRLQQPQLSLPVERPLQVLRPTTASFDPSSGSAQLLQLLG
jgi:hypothetical protein